MFTPNQERLLNSIIAGIHLNRALTFFESTSKAADVYCRVTAAAEQEFQEAVALATTPNEMGMAMAKRRDAVYSAFLELNKKRKMAERVYETWIC